jgi:hypothetical protein
MQAASEVPPVTPYPVAPLHNYPPPWPGTQIKIQNPNAPFAVVPQPAQNTLFFRFAPGNAQANQIQTSSWPCRKVVLYAPGVGADVSNLKSIYMALQGGAVAQGLHTAEFPPGSSLTIEVSDINLLWFVAQNATDLVTGFAESYP